MEGKPHIDEGRFSHKSYILTWQTREIRKRHPASERVETLIETMNELFEALLLLAVSNFTLAWDVFYGEQRNKAIENLRKTFR